MKKARRIAYLLSLALLVGLTPITALADKPTTLNVDGTSILEADGNRVVCGEGAAEYDEDSNTLTLTNVTIEGDFSGQAAIFANGDLTIRLVGTNTITSGYFGVNTSNGTITVGGSGTLTIEADNNCMRATDLVIGIPGEEESPTVNVTGRGGYASGLYATNTVTVQNGAVVNAECINGFAVCGENGVFISDSEVDSSATGTETNTLATWGRLEITGSKVTASSNGYAAVYAEDTIEISNSSVEASAETRTAIYSDNAVNITDSAVKAQSPSEYNSVGGASGGSLSGTWLDSVGAGIQSEIINNAQNSVVIQNGFGTVVGDAVLKQDVEIRADVELTIPEGASLTVPEGITLQNNGTVVSNGSFIKNDNATVICADGSHTGGAATCVSKAVCDICGLEYGELGAHELTHHDAEPQTCTEPGSMEYWQCQTCGKSFADAEGTEELADTAVPAAGHDAVKTEAKAPTASEPGNIEYWRCERCGKYFEDEALTQEITRAQTVLAATGQDSPQTGDDSLLWVCAALSVGAALAFILGRKKKLINA